MNDQNVAIGAGVVAVLSVVAGLGAITYALMPGGHYDTVVDDAGVTTLVDTTFPGDGLCRLCEVVLFDGTAHSNSAQEFCGSTPTDPDAYTAAVGDGFVRAAACSDPYMQSTGGLRGGKVAHQQDISNALGCACARSAACFVCSPTDDAGCSPAPAQTTLQPNTWTGDCAPKPCLEFAEVVSVQGLGYSMPAECPAF